MADPCHPTYQSDDVHSGPNLDPPGTYKRYMYTQGSYTSSEFSERSLNPGFDQVAMTTSAIASFARLNKRFNLDIWQTEPTNLHPMIVLQSDLSPLDI